MGDASPPLQIRWTPLETVKPYARPFAVTFHEPAHGVEGSVAVDGLELGYYRQFQAAVLQLSGRRAAWTAMMRGLLAAPDAG